MIIAGQGNSSAESGYEFIDKKVIAGASYSYKLESVSYGGVIKVEQTVEVNIPIPEEFVLFNNYPNPFNPTTNIKFQVPENSNVKLAVYDLNGKLIKQLLNNSYYSIGVHSVVWDATDEFGNKVSSGMYLYRFSSGRFAKLGKMVLMK